MERRHFLGAGAGAAAGGLAPRVAQCAIPHGLEARLAEMDRTSEALASSILCDLTAPTAEEEASWAEYDRLIRSSLRSLHVAGTFHDMAREERADPRMQERVRSAMPEMDFAVFGVADALHEIGPEERARVRAEYLRDPSLREEVLARLHGGFDAAGISDDRHGAARSLVRQVDRELSRARPSGAVDDAIRRVRRLSCESTGGPEEWGAIVMQEGDEPPATEEGPKKYSHRMLAIGAWLMGIGVVGGGALIAGGELAGSCDAVCIGAGLGAFLLVVALGFLLAGAVMRRRENRPAASPR